MKRKTLTGSGQFQNGGKAEQKKSSLLFRETFANGERNKNKNYGECQLSFGDDLE